MNRLYLPRWLNISLWLIAEATIICTDVGQVRRNSIKNPLLLHANINRLSVLVLLLTYSTEISLF
jgi:hypothetical protein